MISGNVLPEVIPRQKGTVSATIKGVKRIVPFKLEEFEKGT
jgi:hypothetical protein